MSNEMTVSFPGGKKVYAGYNGFEIATDQNLESGGQGSAPEPYDLFLASLATCAGIYILSFCQRRALPVEGITMTQSWERSVGMRKSGPPDDQHPASSIPASSIQHPRPPDS